MSSRPPDPAFTCLDLLAERARREDGMEDARVDHERREIEFAFDPEKVSVDDVRRAAARLGPALQATFRRSVMHLDGRATERTGTRAARRMETRPGVRRAIAGFVGGVLTITFDPEQTDEQRLLQEARESGISVKTSDEAAEEASFLETLRRGSLGQRLRYWFTGDRLEQVLVGFAFITMIGGLVVEHILGLGAPAWTLFVISYACGGWFGVTSAIDSLRDGDIDIDLLMVLAALGAAAVGEPFEGAMLLFLFALSNVLQGYALGRTRNAIEGLARLRPRTARVRRDESWIDLPLDDVVVGDRIRLKPGEQVPLDAEVVEGESAVDQSSVTGESIPVVKHPGDDLFAGTHNQNGSLTARVSRTAADSTLARMIALVEEAQSRKAQTQRFLEQTEKRYAVGVIGFTIFLALSLPTLFGLTWSEGFYRAITVMVVASPCALVISTPASILSAIANAARNGILFKGGGQLEKAARVETIAFDKTGTLTEGKPTVVDSWSAREEVSVTELTALAAALEERSEHPLAQAIVTYARSRDLELPNCSGFSSETGKGVSGTVRGHRITVGSAAWILSQSTATEAALEQIEAWENQARTVVAVMMVSDETDQGILLGMLAISDPVRKEAAAVIRTLRATGIRRTAMLTGDNRATAASIAQQVGIDEFYAELLPEDKVRLLRQLGEDEEIAMVGDGTNDAPALATAGLGIAMGAAGSDIAMESADVVLMSNDLTRIPHALALSRQARTIVKQNLAFAGGIIVIMVLLTLFLPVIAPGVTVPLPLGVVAHEGGTVLVCLNGLRLLAWKP